MGDDIPVVTPEFLGDDLNLRLKTFINSYGSLAPVSIAGLLVLNLTDVELSQLITHIRDYKEWA